MWPKLRRWLTTLGRFIRRDNLPKLVILIILVVCGGTLGLAYFESVPLASALWWTVVTITTVGYGDITPVTIGGRLIGTVTMLTGIGLLGILTAALASLMVGMKLEGIRGMRTIDCTDQIVICGWNYKAKDILDELHADGGTLNIPIVLIADLAEIPLEAPHLFFVRGEVTKDTMEQANMRSGRAAIVLGDESVDAFSRDARTILTTLTIKTAFPHLYTCVELVDAHNLTHCQLARADEIIVSGALTSNLLVRAALDHGVTRVVSELLSSRGHELFLTPVPTAVVGHTFLDALTQLKHDYNALIVAVQSGNGDLQTNPNSSYTMAPDDYLYLIAEHRPQFSP
jgi:voltage-gated potassium channel